MTYEQMDLLTSPPTAGRSRRNDPVSSKHAARRVNVGSQRGRILSALQNGPKTADELGVILGVHRSIVATRLAQMRDRGEVEVAAFAPGSGDFIVQQWRLARVWVVEDVKVNGERL